MKSKPLEWFTKCRPVITETNKYTIMHRHPDDPERRPRPKGGQKDKTPHLTFRKMSESQVAKALLRHLADGVPRTLNRIGVEIWDKTADILMGTIVEDVLWALCEDGSLAFTMKAPILFKERVDEKHEVKAMEAQEDPYTDTKALLTTRSKFRRRW